MLGRALALKAAGVHRFDAGELQTIEVLLAKAEGAREGLKARLEERARKHLFALELRFQAAQSDALEIIERVARVDAAAARELRERVAAGDVDGARREAARVLGQQDPRRMRPALERVQKTLELVETRCSTLPPVVREARELLEGHVIADDDVVARAHDVANLLDLVIISDGAEELRSMLEVDRMERGAPAAPGPYNPDALAARAIGELSSISPAFARAWLSWVKDLESLTRLPPTPDEKPAKPVKAARQTRGASGPKKKRSTGGR